MNKNGKKSEKDKKHTHFPLFVDTREKKAVVIGGGNIALRRIKTLCTFCFEIVVIAPDIKGEIEVLAEDYPIRILRELYDERHLSNTFIAIAVTDNRQVNHAIGIACKERGIPVSVADSREECTFFFPAIVADETVIGICGDGKDHKAVAERAAGVRAWLSEELASKKDYV